jgi:hypothetical protein
MATLYWEKNDNGENCLFVNNDDSLGLFSDVINTAMYRRDCVYLNLHGTLKLVDNLGIPARYPTIIVITVAQKVRIGSVSRQITDIITWSRYANEPVYSRSFHNQFGRDCMIV